MCATCPPWSSASAWSRCPEWPILIEVAQAILPRDNLSPLVLSWFRHHVEQHHPSWFSSPFRYWRKFSYIPPKLPISGLTKCVLKWYLTILQCVLPVLWSSFLLSCHLQIKYFCCFSCPMLSCSVLACRLYSFVILVLDYSMHPCPMKVWYK